MVVIYYVLRADRVLMTIDSVKWYLQQYFGEYMSLIKLTLAVLIINHTCACLWHYVG